VTAASPTDATSARAGAATRAVSVADGPLLVRESPSTSARVVSELSETTRLGSPRVLLVRSVRTGWVQVDLPVRPNGGQGWVPADQVRVEDVHARITVSLSERKLTLTLPGQESMTATVAVGSDRYPTPTGRFYVIDRVRPDDSSGPYGAFALGLSGYSDTLSEFGSGDGQIGIHGTNEPSSMGKAVSHGCIRVPDSLATRLQAVPLGTPVTIST
jgi:lipoprotein-anchoring transpeptidase ErfK/SrfK